MASHDQKTAVMIYRDATKDDWRDVYAGDRTARSKEKLKQAGIESVAGAIFWKHIQTIQSASTSTNKQTVTDLLIDDGYSNWKAQQNCKMNHDDTLTAE